MASDMAAACPDPLGLELANGKRRIRQVLRRLPGVIKSGVALPVNQILDVVPGKALAHDALDLELRLCVLRDETAGQGSGASPTCALSCETWNTLWRGL